MSNIMEDIGSPFHQKLLEVIRDDNAADVTVNKKYIESIVDAIPGGLLVYQITDGRCKDLYISPRIPEFLGFTMAEYMEMNGTNDFVWERDRAYLSSEFHKSADNASDMDITVRFVHKSGRLVWVNISSKVILNYNGTTVFCGVLQETNAAIFVYKELLDEVDEMICVWGKESKSVIYMNKAMMKSFETVPEFIEELIKYGGDYIGAIPNKEKGYNIIHNVTSGNKAYDIKSKTVNAFGRKAIVVCISDVTEKKVLQSRFDDVVSTLACSCIKMKNNKEWTVVEANDMFYDIIGYTPVEFKELKNNSFASLVPDKQTIKKHEQTDNPADNFLQQEYYIRAKDDSVRYIIDQSILVEEDGEEYFYSTFIDITERRLNEILIEERYREEINYKDSMAENFFAYLKLNITKGMVMDWNVHNDNDTKLKSGITINEFFSLLSDNNCDEETVKALYQNFSIKKLSKNYKAGKKNYTVEQYIRFVDGKDMWLSVQVSLRVNPYTKDMEGFIYFEDITDEKYISQAITEEVTREYDFIACINANKNKSIIVDTNYSDKRKSYVCSDYNAEVERYSATMLLEEHTKELKNLLCLDTVLSELEKKDVYKARHMEMRTAGEYKYKEYRYYYLDREKGLIIYSQKDITDQVEKDKLAMLNGMGIQDTEEVKKLVADYADRLDKFKSDIISKIYINDVTGLPTMHGFSMEVKKIIEKAPNEEYYMVVRDINNFKVFNELYGRAKGDEFLKYFAEHFNRHIKEMGGICGHLGDDDFVAFYKCSSIDNFTNISDKLSREIRRFPVDYRFITTAGVYKVEDVNMPVTAMCDRAKLALRSAKNTMKSYAVYDDNMRTNVIHSQEIVNNFTEALKERQIKVYLQPQYNINNGKIVGAEALTRWIHPEKGIISPGEFIPVLEKNGLISSLDRFVVDEILKLMKMLSDNIKGGMPPSIAVNFSRMDVLNPSTIAYLENLREKYNMPTKALRIEITESIYVSQPAYMIRFVNKLRRRGYKVEMDDFGSGYSSLNALKDFDIDLLKLDMEFMSAFNTDKGNKIINAVVAMANAIGIPVLTEGIETIEQRDFLKSVGCNYVQGYYYGRPMPIEDYIKLLLSSEYEYIK